MKQKRLLKVHAPNVVWVSLILLNSIDYGRLSFQVRFLNIVIERHHLYLFYKLLNTSVTLFLHILWRVMHSWSKAPCMWCTDRLSQFILQYERTINIIHNKNIPLMYVPFCLSNEYTINNVNPRRMGIFYKPMMAPMFISAPRNGKRLIFSGY